MSLTLILMRHAKSAWNVPNLTDHDRPLNRRGVASAQAMGTWLRTHGHIPDAAISSSSTRTYQTLEGLRLDVPVVYTRTLYHADAETMMDVLNAQKELRVLMLGHNPGIADFAHRLIATPASHPRFADFPTGATAVLTFKATQWSKAVWHTGQLMDFAIPREVIA